MTSSANFVIHCLALVCFLGVGYVLLRLQAQRDFLRLVLRLGPEGMVPVRSAYVLARKLAHALDIPLTVEGSSHDRKPRLVRFAALLHLLRECRVIEIQFRTAPGTDDHIQFVVAQMPHDDVNLCSALSRELRVKITLDQQRGSVP